MSKKTIGWIAAVVVAAIVAAVAMYLYGERIKQRAEARLQAEIERNEQAQKDWLAKNEKWLTDKAAEPGFQKTESGIVYKVLEQGTGAVPTRDDRVTVHYEGSDVDGIVFDSSYRRGEPASFGVTQVIPGWIEMLCMMPVGSKYEVYIPCHLAYGPDGMGEKIRPSSALKFTIELLGIE